MKIIDGTQRLPELKKLIVEYTDSLHMDLSFQNLSDELAHLEQRYVPPYGRIYAAVADEGWLSVVLPITVMMTAGAK